MSKILITTVGTSVFTNLLNKKNAKNIGGVGDFFENINNKLYYGNESFAEEDFSDIKISIVDKIRLYNTSESCTSSSELDSINCFIEENKSVISENNKVKIILLCTDSLSSYYSAKVVQEYLTNVYDKKELIEVELEDPVKNLVISNNISNSNGIQTDLVNKGLNNFYNIISKILNFKNDKKFEFVFNASGGYKVVSAYFVILGQLNPKSEVIYLYEGNNKLTRVPTLPVDFKYELFEYYNYYLTIAAFNPDAQEYYLNKTNSSEDDLRRLTEMGILTDEDDKYKFTPFGCFLKKYMESNAPSGKSTLGVYAEYKIYEYYINKIYINKSETQYKACYHSTGGYTEGSDSKPEIDILLKYNSENEEYCFCEVKSISDLFMYRNKEADETILSEIIKGEKKKDFKLLEQIAERLRYAQGQSEMKTLKEFKLFFYSLIDINDSFEEAKDLAEKVGKYINSIINELSPKVLFKIYIVRMSDSINKKADRVIPYQEFLKRKLKCENIQPIFSINNQSMEA